MNNESKSAEFQPELTIVMVVLFVIACLFLMYFPRKDMPKEKSAPKQEQTISK